MANYDHIPLFWWSEPRLMGKKTENYGDLLSKYLVEKISGKTVRWVQPRKMPWYSKNKSNYLAAGSIIHHANKHSIVWGSGIIDQQQEIASADFKAVRGPETRNFLIEKGYNCPNVFGDPAILLPIFFKPAFRKRFKLGIIPHYNDLEQVRNDYRDISDSRIIDIRTDDIEKTSLEILECENIVSSSLHGVIVAQSYGIPAVCVKFSERVFGNGIKYKDYYRSLGCENFTQEDLRLPIKQDEIKSLFSDSFQPSSEKLNELKKGLLRVCPFND